MNSVKDMHIPQKCVTIFAGGESSFNVRDYTPLKETFTIAINEYFITDAPIKIDARIWTDYRITKVIKDIWTRTGHKEQWITRSDSFCKAKDTAMMSIVSYWYDHKKDNLNNRRYTLLTILELIRKYFPDKYILVFGLDCKDDKRYTYKQGRIRWVNGHYSKSPKAPFKDCLQEIKEMIENQDNLFLCRIFNCNLDSKVNMLKKDYKDVLAEYN